MKKIIIYLALFAFVRTSFAQQPNSSQPLTSKDFLAKSKRQATAAKVLLIGGGIVTLTTILIAAPGNTSFESLGNILTIGTIGALAALGSIPLFIASSHNKRRAMTVSANLALENSSLVSRSRIIQYSYPAISFKVSL